MTLLYNLKDSIIFYKSILKILIAPRNLLLKLKEYNYNKFAKI